MIHLRLFGRGFLIVCLTATNVVQISRGRMAGAFIVGTAISYVWYGNSQRANDARGTSAQVAYALGAGVGTVIGMWLGSAF